ncbi:hypothetical protein EAF04_001372 [Stromatinia cepivora]|nr:hypothetical protein EAF04_001372 [Stromatinia cepivora]
MDSSKENSIRNSITTSPPSGFLSLPRKVRDDIYQRLLIVAHPLYLFQEKGAEAVEMFAPDRPVRWLALLYTNRQIHEEACAVLYQLNNFTFMNTTQHQANLLQSFLTCIGSINASQLSHICINFPVAENVKDQPGKLILREDDLRSLKLLQEKCTKLTTLEALVYSYNPIGLAKASQDSDDLRLIQEVFSQVNRQFNAIPSLKKIIVRFYNGSPTHEVKELMQQLQWIVSFG